MLPYISLFILVNVLCSFENVFEFVFVFVCGCECWICFFANKGSKTPNQPNISAVYDFISIIRAHMQSIAQSKMDFVNLSHSLCCWIRFGFNVVHYIPICVRVCVCMYVVVCHTVCSSLKIYNAG